MNYTDYNYVNENNEKREEIKLLPLADVPDGEARFLFYPYIVRGKITIVQGDPGVGKTALMCKIAAETTKGGCIVNSRCEKPGKVLLLSMEDDGGVLRGRVAAGGGDLTQCYIVQTEKQLTFESEELEDLFREYGFSLVVFDPFQNFFEGDMNRSNETHRALSKISVLAEKYDTAVVIVVHMTKASAGSQTIYRALGSIDIIGSCRSALHVGVNPDNKDEKIICHIKHNTSPKGSSVAYSIGDRGGVKWEGYSSLGPSDLTGEGKKEAPKATPVAYDAEPAVIGIRKLMSENPRGLFISYQDLGEYILDVTGEMKYTEPKILSRRLKELKSDFRLKDKLAVSQDRQRSEEYICMGEVKRVRRPNALRGVHIKEYYPPDYAQYEMNSAFHIM